MSYSSHSRARGRGERPEIATAYDSFWEEDTPDRPPRRRNGGGGGGYGGGRRRAKPSGQTDWRRYIPSWKVVLGVCGLGVLGVFTLVGVAYAMTPVPTANADATKQSSIIYYNDGKTELARIGELDRENVRLDQVPDYVENAVLAAENRSFWNDSGVSVTGLARAVWNNLTGGETQGGSTITQQMAKNYYLSQERTISRKFKELFISIKVEQKYTKQQILETYLNTIYFDRSAYGIQAASKAYFGVPVQQIKPDEGAMLAAIIQNPTQLGPGGNREQVAATVERFHYVLGGMVEMGTMSPAEANRYKSTGKLPQDRIIKKANGRNEMYRGQNGFIIERVKDELKTYGNITDQEIDQQGLRIYTTIDKKQMAYAQRAVRSSLPRNLPNRIQVGLVSVAPKTGGVTAMYGGRDYLKRQFDNVWQGTAQPGSSFKPYVLAAALEEGYSLRSLIDGHSPKWFGSDGSISSTPTSEGYRVANDGDAQYGAINLIKATKSSVNTAYVQLGMEVGIDKIIQTGEDVGIRPEELEPHQGRAGVALGIANIRPVEQAAGFATFANEGHYIQPHVVHKVTKGSIKAEPYKPITWKKGRPFDASVAADATYAMQQVVKPGGTGYRAALPDRPAAGKTGTTEKNVAAWFVGYVPQLSTAVTMYDTKNKTMLINGQPVYGGRVMTQVWHNFMAKATNGMEVKQFPPPAFGGEVQRWATPKPTPTPSASDPDGRCKPRRYEMSRPDCPPGQPTVQPEPTCGLFEPDCGESESPEPSPEPSRSCRPPLCSTEPPRNDTDTATKQQTRAYD